MKFSTLILTGSLAANVVLLGLMVIGPSDDGSSAARTARELAAASKTSTSIEPAAPGPETWANLQSGDLAAQRDQLRAAGFPPEVVNAILRAQVMDSFAARRKAIEGAAGDLPFWKNPIRDPKMQAAMRDLYREQSKVMKDLIGRDALNDDPVYLAYVRRQFGNLPDDKVEQLRQIQDDYNQKRSDIFTNAGNGTGIVAEDRQKLADLEKAMRADFAAALTPEQLADYELRSSNTAQQLRYNLAAFDATEPEYKAIFKLQQEFDQKYSGMYGPLSQEDMKGRMEAQKQLTADIKTALGPDRATDYERATDYSYRQASQLVARLELPPENAISLWNTKKEIEARRTDIYNAVSTLPPAERMTAITAQLTALQQEAVAKITPLLGGNPSRVEVYKVNGGQWLQNLVPRPAPPRPPGR